MRQTRRRFVRYACAFDFKFRGKLVGRRKHCTWTKYPECPSIRVIYIYIYIYTRIYARPRVCRSLFLARIINNYPVRQVPRVRIKSYTHGVLPKVRETRQSCCGGARGYAKSLRLRFTLTNGCRVENRVKKRRNVPVKHVFRFRPALHNCAESDLRGKAPGRILVRPHRCLSNWKRT